MKPAAYIDGWMAHYNDIRGDNPYDMVSQEASYIAWDAGYCARYNYLKHGKAERVSLLDNEYNAYICTL